MASGKDVPPALLLESNESGEPTVLTFALVSVESVDDEHTATYEFKKRLIEPSEKGDTQRLVGLGWLRMYKGYTYASIPDPKPIVLRIKDGEGKYENPNTGFDKIT